MGEVQWRTRVPRNRQGSPQGGPGPSEGPLTTLTLQHALAVGNVTGQYAVLAYNSRCCL